MPTDDEIKAAEEAAAAKADADAKAKAEADELAASGITTDAGKEALRKEREARRNAERAEKAANDRAAALEAKQAEADKAKAAAEEADAIKRGEFEQLANTRAEEVKAVTGERDGYKTQLDSLIAAIKPDVEKQWTSAPESVTKLYKGDANDVLGKREFLTDHAELITELTAQQEQKNEALRKYPITPRPNGNAPTDVKPLVPAKF